MGTLPATLEPNLPTQDDFARDFPVMTLVRLRMEIELELRGLLARASRPAGRQG